MAGSTSGDPPENGRSAGAIFPDAPTSIHIGHRNAASAKGTS